MRTLAFYIPNSMIYTDTRHSLVGNNNNKLDPRSPNDTRLCEKAQCDLFEVGFRTIPS